MKTFIAIFLVLDIGSVLVYLFTYPGGFPKITITLSMIVLALYAGINEEISDRAIPAAIMMRNKPTTRRVLAIVILTSVFFGGGHIVNLLAGQDLATTIIQMIFADGAFFMLQNIFGVAVSMMSNVACQGVKVTKLGCCLLPESN